MTRRRLNGRDGRVLWLRYREAVGEAVGAPGDEEGVLLLAAYLDGRLDEGELARVERWLAADAAALETLIAARAGLGTEAVAPAGLVPRAQSLVGERRPLAAEAGVGALTWLRAWLSPGLPLWQPVGLALAVLLASVGGFEFGQGSMLSRQPATLHGGVFDLAPPSDGLF